MLCVLLEWGIEMLARMWPLGGTRSYKDVCLHRCPTERQTSSPSDCNRGLKSGSYNLLQWLCTSITTKVQMVQTLRISVLRHLFCCSVYSLNQKSLPCTLTRVIKNTYLALLITGLFVWNTDLVLPRPAHIIKTSILYFYPLANLLEIIFFFFFLHLLATLLEAPTLCFHLLVTLLETQV